jgi:ATP-dependent DNA ligase
LRRLATNRNFAGMAAPIIPADGFVAPCIPTLAHKPPSGPDWVHEIKHDGYRLIVRRDGRAVRLFTRCGYDWTDRYPAIAGAAGKLRARSFDVDGEAVVCGADGVAVFDALHRRRKAGDAILYAFDLIELNGEDFRPLPIGKRKAQLARPTSRIIRANGDKAFFGWPNIPQIEAEVAAWYDAKTLDEEKIIARRINKAAFDNAIYAPLGVYFQQQAWRRNVTGVVQGPLPFLWGVSKTA